MLTSSSSPALRKAALIVPPPTIAMRSTPNSVYRISTALYRTICFSPQTIHEICRESRYARYCWILCYKHTGFCQFELCSCVDCHTAPTANTDDTNSVCINILLYGQKIHSRTERTAYCNGREFAGCILGNIHIRYKHNAIAVIKSGFLCSNLLSEVIHQLSLSTPSGGWHTRTHNRYMHVSIMEKRIPQMRLQIAPSVSMVILVKH